jgi:phosphoribosylcarboxyaminoimidazole (NCAIR) mutase
MKSKPKVSIVMGSKSDYPTMKFCENILNNFSFKVNYR